MKETDSPIPINPQTPTLPATNISFDAFLPDEMARRAEEAGVKKAGLSVAKMFLLAILAGAFISLGAIFATSVTAGGAEIPFGIRRLVGGIAFSLGLILVIVAGAELFTGNNLIVMAWASRRITTANLLKNWGIVYAGNLFGSLATAGIVLIAGHHGQGGGAIGQNALAIANTKCELGLVQAVALGILCNALVCLAVWLCLSARSTTDKILSILFPITAFVAAGFEHCVANMYFVPYGIWLRGSADSSFWNSIEQTPNDYASLTWENFLIQNLIPVTIGNIIGGTVMVGVVYWLIHRSKW